MRTRTLFVRPVSRGERLRHMTEFGIETHVSAPRRRAPFDIFASADPRTLEILRRRHTARHPRRRGWLVRRALVVADLAGLAAAMVTVELIFGQGSGAANRVHPLLEALVLLATLPGWIVIARFYRLYDRDEERTRPLDGRRPRRRLPPRHRRRLALLRRASALTGVADPQLSKMFAFWVAGDRASSPSRAPSRARWCRRSITYLQNTIIVGAGDVGQLRRAQADPATPSTASTSSASSTTRRRSCATDLEHVQLLGSPDDAARAGRELLDVERVVDRLLERLRRADARARPVAATTLDVQIDIVPRLFELVGPSVKIAHASRGCRSSGCRRRGSRRSSRCGQARDRHRRCVRRAAAHRAALRVHRAADQARLARPGVLPPDAARARTSASSRRSSSAR